MKSLIIRVSVYDLNTKEKIREVVKDLAYDATRRWLASVTLWACSNHCAIEITNVSDK